MARNPETKGYVSWADMMSSWRWIEMGYSVRLTMDVKVKCPPGEQWEHMYHQLHAYDLDGQSVPLSCRVLGMFPQSQYSSVPGLYLAMLYKMEAELGKVRVWTEPPFRAPKVPALARG